MVTRYTVLFSLTILKFMTKVIGMRRPYAITIRKKFGDPKAAVSGGYYGEACYGDGGFGSTDPDPNAWYYGIYQMRRCKEGKIPVQMKFYKPTNPQTDAQQIQRGKISNAVFNWQHLTDSEKAVYNRRAFVYHITGYNLYCKEYLLSQ